MAGGSCHSFLTLYLCPNLCIPYWPHQLNMDFSSFDFNELALRLDRTNPRFVLHQSGQCCIIVCKRDRQTPRPLIILSIRTSPIYRQCTHICICMTRMHNLLTNGSHLALCEDQATEWCAAGRGKGPPCSNEWAHAAVHAESCAVQLEIPTQSFAQLRCEGTPEEVLIHQVCLDS